MLLSATMLVAFAPTTACTSIFRGGSILRNDSQSGQSAQYAAPGAPRFCSFCLELDLRSGFFEEMRNLGRLAPAPTSAASAAGKNASAFDHECVELFAELVQVLGVPRSLGQIYGLLFASSEPLHFATIVDQLAISKGSASQGLRLLRTLGAVKSVRSPDGRREEFLPEIRLRPLVGGLVRERIEPLTKESGTRMARLRALAHRSPSAAKKRFSLQRVKQLEQWRQQIGLLLPFLKGISDSTHA